MCRRGSQCSSSKSFGNMAVSEIFTIEIAFSIVFNSMQTVNECNREAQTMRLQFKYRINQRKINLCVVTIAELCYIRFVFRTDSVHKNACIYLTSNSTFRLFGVRMGLITKIRFLTLLCFFRNRF